MIQTPFFYLLTVTLFAALALKLSTLERKVKLLHFIPPIVLLYLSLMALSSLGLFEQNETSTQVYKTLKSNLLPAMLFLMLLPNKLSKLFNLGPKMLLSFSLATFSLFIAFILSFIVFGLSASYISILSPLAGSWMGGTGNMLAVASAINTTENEIGITMLIDSVDYSLWLMFLLLITPLAHAFNHFTKASSPVDTLKIEQTCALHFSLRSYVILITSALLVSLLSQLLAASLSQSLFGSVSTWSVLIATLAGLLLSFSPLSRIKGLQGTANAMLYLLIALIASRANIELNFNLLFYIGIGLFILIIHALFMLFFAKLFKLDLFSISVASLANIGGIASAPILAAAYSQSLVGVGVLMASLGYIIGTFVPLLLVQVLRWMI